MGRDFFQKIGQICFIQSCIGNDNKGKQNNDKHTKPSTTIQTKKKISTHWFFSSILNITWVVIYSL